jgi:rhamnose utilization protein RhaD (predicted bifunctional aldolase and dehydrogenase)
MISGFVERDALAIVDRYAAQGIGRELALRLYTTRLLGRDPKLVLHGGGNTSLKCTLPDLLGEEVAALAIKGSGADMAAIEAAGMPAVRLERLRKLRARPALGDEDMVRILRANLLDPMAPNPSVEVLSHAFLPHKFVDHTHAGPVLSLTNQPDGEAICAEVYGARAGIVPYLMPGFALAKKLAEVYEAAPTVDGLILLKHGIFTFGAEAREAYERMIELVTLAEARLARNRKTVFTTASPLEPLLAPQDIAPILRGAVSLKDEHSEGGPGHPGVGAGHGRDRLGRRPVQRRHEGNQDDLAAHPDGCREHMQGHSDYVDVDGQHVCNPTRQDLVRSLWGWHDRMSRCPRPPHRPPSQPRSPRV